MREQIRVILSYPSAVRLSGRTSSPQVSSINDTHIQHSPPLSVAQMFVWESGPILGAAPGPPDAAAKVALHYKAASIAPLARQVSNATDGGDSNEGVGAVDGSQCIAMTKQDRAPVTCSAPFE